jgi:hypothetical protein
VKAILRKSDQFGPDGPQEGTALYVGEIRKIDGDYWAFTTTLTGQDEYRVFIVKLDDIMTARTENVETYWSTAP